MELSGAMQSMKTVADICKYIGSIVDGNALCVETGCTYAWTQAELDQGYSTTYSIAKYICEPTDGMFYSIDNDASKIEVSRNMVELKCPSIERIFICMDSVEALKHLALTSIIVDVLCLDSKEGDPEHMANEYLSIKDRLADRHFIMIDDIHNPSSVKWKKLVPMLKDMNYNYIEVPTPVGMFLASKGYPLE